MSMFFLVIAGVLALAFVFFYVNALKNMGGGGAGSHQRYVDERS
jgi:hypothetical protein